MRYTASVRVPGRRHGVAPAAVLARPADAVGQEEDVVQPTLVLAAASHAGRLGVAAGGETGRSAGS